MFYVLLIAFFSIHFSLSNNPILIASPYPFNTSESSRIQCFSNDQGIILSLAIIATMLDIGKPHPLIEYSKNDVKKNESIILTIPVPFNYSELRSKIECRSRYHHGEQKISQLEVFSVVEIPQKELFSINTNTKQMITINCLVYGTNIFVHWNFSRDISKNISGSLPIGIRISHRFTTNDTLIIDHVSYSDHHGYYQCYATNKLLGIIYEDRTVIYLNVKKNSIWISIVIGCSVIGICILILSLGSKYCQKRSKIQLEENNIPQEDDETIDTIKQIKSNGNSIESSSHYNKKSNSERIIEDLRIPQENIPTLPQSRNSTKSSLSLLSVQNAVKPITHLNSSANSNNSSQFVLGNPFLNSNVQPLISTKQSTNKFK